MGNNTTILSEDKGACNVDLNVTAQNAEQIDRQYL